MYDLKLIKGRSYSNGKVTVTNTAPFIEVEDLETASELVDTGRFKIIVNKQRVDLTDSGVKVENVDELKDDDSGLPYEADDEPETPKVTMTPTAAAVTTKDTKTKK